MLKSLSRIGSNIKTVFTGVVADSSTIDNSSWHPSIVHYVTGGGSASVDANSITSYQLSAYWACLKVLSEDVAKLPIKVLEKREGGEFSTNESLQNLLSKKPNDNMTAFSYWQAVMQQSLGWGNSFSEIQFNGMGQPVGLWPINPTRVTKMRDKNSSVYFYRINNDDGSFTDLLENEVLYIPGLTIDGVSGLSAAEVGQQSLSLALSGQQFAERFFKNSAAISGVLMHPGKLKEDAVKPLRESWNKIYSGSNNAGKTAILEEGMKFEAITMPLKDAQFLESRNFSIEEIARWFRMPPHKIQHLLRSTFTNIEVQGREYVDDTLMPWLVKIEQEVRRKLIINPSEFIKFNVNALLRGDTATRAAFYTSLFNMGAMNSNEIREFEGLNPYNGGDRFYIQGNLAEVRADGLLMIANDSAIDDGGGDPVEEDITPEESEEVASVDFMKPLVMERIDRLVTREVKTFESAHKKLDQDAFNSKAEEFYNTYKTHLHDNLVKSADAITSITGNEFSIRAFCTKTADTSRQLILNSYGDDDALLALLDEWTKTKASSLSDQFMLLAETRAEFEQKPTVGEYAMDEDGNLIKYTSNLEWERVEQ